jgi:hypothetical protein
VRLGQITPAHREHAEALIAAAGPVRTGLLGLMVAHPIQRMHRERAYNSSCAATGASGEQINGSPRHQPHSADDLARARDRGGDGPGRSCGARGDVGRSHINAAIRSRDGPSPRGCAWSVHQKSPTVAHCEVTQCDLSANAGPPVAPGSRVAAHVRCTGSAYLQVVTEQTFLRIFAGLPLRGPERMELQPVHERGSRCARRNRAGLGRYRRV